MKFFAGRGAQSSFYWNFFYWKERQFGQSDGENEIPTLRANEILEYKVGVLNQL